MSAPTNPISHPFEVTDLGSVVTLQIPALPAFVSLVRSTAAALAVHVDLTLDEIDDLRIAVSEAVALVFEVAAEGSLLETEFELRSDALLFRVRSGSTTGVLDLEGSWAFQVLSSLATDVVLDVSAPSSVSVAMVKRRGERL